MTGRSRSNRTIRNLRAAGLKSAKFTGRATVGLFRWLTTDRLGMGKTLDYMPKLGFLDRVRYGFLKFLIAVVGSVFQVVWIILIIFYVIPFLLFGHF